MAHLHLARETDPSDSASTVSGPHADGGDLGMGVVCLTLCSHAHFTHVT